MSIQPAVTRWLPSYERSWLRPDGVAGDEVAVDHPVVGERIAALRRLSKRAPFARSSVSG